MRKYLKVNMTLFFFTIQIDWRIGKEIELKKID